MIPSSACGLPGLPLVDRKARLEELVGALRAGTPIRYSEHVVGHRAEIYKRASKAGLEGILSRRAGFYTGRPALPTG